MSSVKNLSFTLPELATLIKILGCVASTIAVAIFLLQSEFVKAGFIDAIWKSLSGALAATTMAFGIFYKWGWRNKTIAQYLKRPLLYGVWIGYLNSDYDDDENNTDNRNDRVLPRDIPIVFVVHQTYLTLSITSYTERQDGESFLEAIIRNHESETVRLKYLFELKKPHKGSSRLVRGTGDLNLIGNGKILEGEYWTSNPTYGKLKLELVSQDCSKVKSFSDATELLQQI